MDSSIEEWRIVKPNWLVGSGYGDEPSYVVVHYGMHPVTVPCPSEIANMGRPGEMLQYGGGKTILIETDKPATKHGHAWHCSFCKKIAPQEIADAASLVGI